MAAKSKTISPVLFFFFFIVLATHLVHGSHEDYDACMSICHKLESAGSPGIAVWACSQACKLVPGSNMFETDEHGSNEFVQNFVEKAKVLLAIHGIRTEYEQQCVIDCVDNMSFFYRESEFEKCTKACESKRLTLTGLVNNGYGVTIIEANPNTFMAPTHWDADALFFVAQGKATINLIRQDKKETLGVKTGDIIRIPSGTKVFMMNKDTMEKLVVIKLPQPAVSTPAAAGHSEVKLLNPFRGDQSSQQQQQLAEVITSVI